jgi:hypothetical protein
METTGNEYKMSNRLSMEEVYNTSFFIYSRSRSWKSLPPPRSLSHFLNLTKSLLKADGRLENPLKSILKSDWGFYFVQLLNVLCKYILFYFLLLIFYRVYSIINYTKD